MKVASILSCDCGATRIEVKGRPLIVTECLCSSCREAAARLEALGSPPILTSYGATPCAEVRKDRFSIVAGAEGLKDFRLSVQAGTRRVIASCCRTPMFLEIKGAHWVSVYLHLWPQGERPHPELRVMAADLPDRSSLPGDIPNLGTHSIAFYARLLLAWAAMGFRNPNIQTAGDFGD